MRSTIFVLCCITTLTTRAQANGSPDTFPAVYPQFAHGQGMPVPPDFHAGDRAKYSTSLAGIPGNMTLVTKSITDAGVWIDQVNETFLKTQHVVQLIEPSTGNVLRMIVDGQEQDPPDPQNIEIVSDTPAQITVPAGSFSVHDIKARLKKEGETSEEWLSFDKVPVLGMVKMDATYKGIHVTAELTEATFTH